jgi:hypothetical protein
MLTSANIITQIQNSYAVETEIYLLYVGILIASEMGNSSFILNKDVEIPVHEATVIGYPMTTNTDYYRTWQDIITNHQFTIEMNKVIDYYKKLGYTINRKSDDMETLYWQITW